jgi:ferric-dicitrate binding protein FerR (iron transport regulator)
MSEERRGMGADGGAGREDDDLGRVIGMAGPRAAVPPERLARIRDTVHASWRESVVRDRRRRTFAWIGVPIAGAAAAASVVVAVLWVRDRVSGDGMPAATIVRVEGRVQRLDGRAAEPGGLLERGSGMSTAAGGRAALRTAAGASLRLDAETTVRCGAPGTFDLERGAIYVDTQGSAKARAVEVRTRLGVVTDVGTQFQVRLTDAGLEVSVRSGGARLLRGGQASPVDAGRRLVVRSDGIVADGQATADGEAWEWTEAIAPPFDLEGRSLGDYLDWLGRETGWRVEFADPRQAAQARGIVLHGSTTGLRPADTPDAVLPACGLRYRLDAGVLVLERATPGAP